MAWLGISVFAYFLNSIAVAIDKALLRRTIPHPAAYAFAVNALGGITAVLLPFVSRPPGALLYLTLAAGAMFTLALLLFYRLLQIGEASRITSLVGGLTPVAVLALGWVFLGEQLTGHELAAFAAIVLGGVAVSHDGTVDARNGRLFSSGMFVALLFGTSYVAVKFVYLQSDFLGTLLWRVAGSALAAFALLIHRESREAIVAAFREPTRRPAALFFGGQSAGAVSAILVNYALAIGHTAIVNALAGLQYVFLFLIALGLGRFFPSLAESSRKNIGGKIAGIVLISLGIALLAFRGS